ncbi:hypothetical protein HNP77_002112 [Treponema rectale]|uniref:Lipoprotein n=1 Tax=Treponema rectale TaxID=744512 RepID=A0A840SG65_9SPIR|nr:hypothetical protein [Treponema rectale]MBB5219730.1 hypothetical protein [Treponema rectale]
MKKICKLMLLLVSVLFLACNPDGAFNDGSSAKARRNKGYRQPENDPFGGEETTAKFWKGYAPFSGIQCWGMGENESWGRNPEIDLDAGTFRSSGDEGGSYMPVFGAYGIGGTGIDGEYDVSSVSSFECDVWSEGSSGKELEISVYHSPLNQKNVILSETPQHVEINLTIQNTTHILFLLGWSNTPSGDIIHIENVAFYDDEGKQVTYIPFKLNESE